MWRSVGAGRVGRAFVGVGVRVGERGEGGGEGCTGIHVSRPNWWGRIGATGGEGGYGGRRW